MPSRQFRFCSLCTNVEFMRERESLAEPKNPKVSLLRLVLFIHHASSFIIHQLVNGLVVMLPSPSFNSIYARPPAQI